MRGREVCVDIKLIIPNKRHFRRAFFGGFGDTMGRRSKVNGLVTRWWQEVLVDIVMDDLKLKTLKSSCDSLMEMLHNNFARF